MISHDSFNFHFSNDDELFSVIFMFSLVKNLQKYFVYFKIRWLVL